jgi:hypothetical protein
MGKYWEDHITWTRLFVISALTDSPDLQVTTQRLLQNQVDIGNAIKPYYGDAAGNQLTALLRHHILVAADVVAAARAGDTGTLNSQMMRWEANADQIGDFLGTANPDNWPAYDNVHLHILVLADELTNGIVAQFPASFDELPLAAHPAID